MKKTGDMLKKYSLSALLGLVLFIVWSSIFVLMIVAKEIFLSNQNAVATLNVVLMVSTLSLFSLIASRMNQYVLEHHIKTYYEKGEELFAGLFFAAGFALALFVTKTSSLALECGKECVEPTVMLVGLTSVAFSFFLAGLFTFGGIRKRR